jgi:hypothetical protein
MFIYKLYITVYQANGYPCSKLSPEDGQVTPETCSYQNKNLNKVTSRWLLIYIADNFTSLRHGNYFVTLRAMSAWCASLSP